MKNCIRFFFLISVSSLFQCADNSFEEHPLDENFPLLLALDTDAGAALADEEDFNVELKLADYLPGARLPNTAIQLDYVITDLEGDMVGHVAIDKVVYEVEVDDCTYERELDFATTGSGLEGTITIAPDADLEAIPESFEIIFKLPGFEETAGSFKVIFSNLQSQGENIQLGFPNVFEYEVLDLEVAGEWVIESLSEEEFEKFKTVFGTVNPDLEKLTFGEITGNIKAEFDFEEMKFVVELVEAVEVTSCEDGQTESEFTNKEIEIEASYDAEDGEINFEGSHLIVNDVGQVEDELDFIIEGAYLADSEEAITYTFFTVIDEDNYTEGNELFRNPVGIAFTFKKD